jgi:hypothetical protein
MAEQFLLFSFWLHCTVMIFLNFRHFSRISAKTRAVGFRPKIGRISHPKVAEFRPSQPKIGQKSYKFEKISRF